MTPDQIATKADIENLKLDLIRSIKEGFQNVSVAQKNPEYISVAKYAQRYNIHPDTVRRRIKAGSLKAELVGGQYRIKVA